MRPRSYDITLIDQGLQPIISSDEKAELSVGCRCKSYSLDSNVTPDLPTPTRLGILESEAGNRAQSDINCGVTLALIGSPHGEIEPKKAAQYQAGTQPAYPDFTDTPPRSLYWKRAARVLGNQWLNGFHLKGHNNLTEGTKKNESAVLGQGRKPR